jgi:hypothetical protein
MKKSDLPGARKPARKTVIKSPVKRRKVKKKSAERMVLENIRNLTLDVQHKLVVMEHKRTEAIESIASSLRTIAQYAADYATRDRVQRLLPADFAPNGLGIVEQLTEPAEPTV